MDIKVNEKVAIVFDLDDTLFKEIDYLKSAYLEIAQLLEPHDSSLLFGKMFAKYRRKEDVFAWLEDTYQKEKQVLIQTYRAHTPTIEPLEGIRDILEKIKAKKGKLAVVTDGRTLTQKRKLEALKILHFFDHVVISEEIGSEKPNKKNFESVMNAFDCSELYYIGDNLKKDFIAPNDLGWTTIGLIDNGQNVHVIDSQYWQKPYMPHHLIHSFNQVNIK